MVKKWLECFGSLVLLVSNCTGPVENNRMSNRVHSLLHCNAPDKPRSVVVLFNGFMMIQDHSKGLWIRTAYRNYLKGSEEFVSSALLTAKIVARCSRSYAKLPAPELIPVSVSKLSGISRSLWMNFEGLEKSSLRRNYVPLVVEFANEREIRGQIACNSFQGGVSIKRRTIQLDDDNPISMSLVRCSTGSETSKSGDTFRRALQNGSKLKFDEQMMIIGDKTTSEVTFYRVG